MKLKLQLWTDLKKSPVYCLYTFCVFINCVAYGITALLPNIYLVDLKYIYDTEIDKISFIASITMLGYMAGSLFGFFYKWINRQLVLTISTFIMAVVVVFTSNYGNMYFLFLLEFLYGVGSGAWDSSSTVWCVEMWPNHKGLMLNLSQFMWSVGSIIAPVLSAPFMYGNVTNATADFVPSIKDRQMSLMIPSSVAGIIQGIGPTILLILFFISPYRYSNDEDISSKICTETSNKFKVKYRKFKLALIAILLSVYNMNEAGYLLFSPTLFQYLDIKLSATASANLLSVVTIGYTLGRFLTGFVTQVVKTKFIIIGNLLLIFGSTIFIYIFQHDLLKLQIASFFIGYGFSGTYPSLFVYTEEKLKLTNKVSTIYALLVGFNTIMLPVVIGPLLKSNAKFLFILMGGNIFFCLILFFVIEIFLSCTK